MIGKNVLGSKILQTHKILRTTEEDARSYGLLVRKIFERKVIINNITLNIMESVPFIALAPQCSLRK